MLRLTAHPLYVLLLLFLTGPTLSAQLFSNNFTVDLDGWTAQGDWAWDANGKADEIPAVEWENRSRLRSKSEGGAAMFASDLPDGQLISPLITLGGSPALFVSFYQYFRSAGGFARLQVQGPGGNTLFSRDLTPALSASDETSAGNYQIIDVSEVLSLGVPAVRIVFDVEGDVEFWLVDDLRVQTNRPAWPAFPIFFDTQLRDFGIPYTVDSSSMPFVPFEVVIDFAPTATPTDRADIRDAFKPLTIETCVCDRLEVWKMGGGVFFDPVTGQPLGDPGDILERVLDSGDGSSSEVDNIEFNFYNYNQLEVHPANAGVPLPPNSLPFLTDAPSGVTKVAILDTGLDLDHPTLKPYLYKNGDGLGNTTDDDGNCYADDILGWNFVDGNNNPVDDHGHGTHVAGIVAEGVQDCGDCTIQLIPYKTHNNHGVGTLFATACAVLQAAVNDEVDVINASWGFYGSGSDILRRAIDTANVYGAVVVAAAGNDSLNLVADAQFPATYSAANVIGVGTFTQLGSSTYDRAAFSNYNPEFIDIFAEGTNVSSTVPDDDMGIKSGTSMSAPAVSASAALGICQTGNTPAEVVDALLADAEKYPADLSGLVANGSILNVTNPCDGEEPPTTTGSIAPVTACLCHPEEARRVTLKSRGAKSPFNVSVLTRKGDLVKEIRQVAFDENNRFTFDLGADESGTYLLVLEFRGEKRVLRVTKK